MNTKMMKYIRNCGDAGGASFGISFVLLDFIGTACIQSRHTVCGNRSFVGVGILEIFFAGAGFVCNGNCFGTKKGLK